MAWVASSIVYVMLMEINATRFGSSSRLFCKIYNGRISVNGPSSILQLTTTREGHVGHPGSVKSKLNDRQKMLSYNAGNKVNRKIYNTVQLKRRRTIQNEVHRVRIIKET